MILIFSLKYFEGLKHKYRLISETFDIIITLVVQKNVSNFYLKA